MTTPVAKRMKRLLNSTPATQSAKRAEKRLSESEYKAVQKRYRTILTQGERELPPIPQRQKVQRGKVAKSDAHNLWERMKKYAKAVLSVAKHPDVSIHQQPGRARLAHELGQAESLRVLLVPESTPKPIAESQATSSPWRTRDTILWWP